MAGSSRREEIGCRVCDAWADDMISLVDHQAMVCRACAARIGRHILANSPASVARFWPRSDASAPPPAPLSPASINVEEVFAAFKRGAEKQASADDAQAHLDLAGAYGEMGLMTDAVREGSVALGAGASLAISSRALNWLFARGRAHPDALPAVVADLRRAHARLH
jgi:hypothetical protein